MMAANSIVEKVAIGFQSLKIRNYRLFIAGQAISQIGTWMQFTAQAWLVVRLTNSPLALGIVTALQYLPVTILSLYGGVLADQLPKRQTLIVTQSLLLIQALIFGILVATGTVQLWQVYLLAMLQGAVTAIDSPVRQVFSVELVGRDELPNAVALNSMTLNGAKIIGPSLAGVIIAQIDTAPTLFLNAISFVAVIIGLLMMRDAELFTVAKRAQGSVRQQLNEGFAYIWHTPEIMAIMIVTAAIGTFGYNFNVVLPLLAKFVLRTDAAGFGLLSSIFGIGAFVAAIGTAYIKHVTSRRLLIAGTAFSLLLGGVSLCVNINLSAFLLAALGATGLICITSVTTILQLIVPDNLRGRVMSLAVLLVGGTTPIGGFLIGFMSDRLGVPAALVTCSILCLAGVAAALLYQRRAFAV
jgi:MFS family permease